MTDAPAKLSAATANAAGIPPPAESEQQNGIAMPPKVAAAVIAVMEKVPKLEKSERNTHGNYNFASIDGFLEALRPLCAKNGLIIIQDEESFELKQSQNKKGETVTWLIVRFRFTLAHSSGETWVHRPARTIMVNAAMGAQAFGAAQSYALKQFMRALFQIATGEADVDSDPRPEFDRDRQEDRMADRIVKHTLRKDIARPPAAGAKVFVVVDQFGEEAWQTENVDDYAERLSELLEKMPNLAEIEQLWANNKEQVNSLPDSRAADVTALYEGRSAELAGEPPQTILGAG